MKIKERLQKYFREKSAFRITTDMLFYLLILAILLPFSRKHVMTGFNKVLMMRPSVIKEANQAVLGPEDYEWVLVDLEGNPVPLSVFREKVVFLSIWATWCPPCRAEMPNIQRLYNDYGDRVAMILASNEEEQRLKDFLAEYDYDLPVYRMVRTPPAVFRTSSIPTTFLITAEGRIVVQKTGAARWDGKYFRDYLDSLLE